MPQSLSSAARLVSCGSVRAIRRIQQEEDLAALREVRLEHVDFGREEIGLRAGDDQHRGVGRHLLLLREHDLVGREIVGAERRRDRAVAAPVARPSVLCSPCPWTKYTLCCLPCTTLIRPLVSSCSPSDVTRSVRPSYSNTTVPSAVTLYWLRQRRPPLEVDVLDLQLLRLTYWYSSSRSRNRWNPSVRRTRGSRTGFFRPCSTFLVWSDSENCCAAVRSQRLLCRVREVVDRHQDREHDEDACRRQACRAAPAGPRTTARRRATG